MSDTELSPEYRAAWNEWEELVRAKAPKEQWLPAWRRVNEILDRESAEDGS